MKVVAKAWPPATPMISRDAGAGIAAVDDVLGLEQPPTPTPSTRQRPSRRSLDRGAEGAHGGGGGEHVLAFEQALDRGLADGERAQDQGAVRDRLVAGWHGSCRRAAPTAAR